MKQLLILALIVPSFVFGLEDLKVQPQVMRTKSEVNPDLKKDEAVFVFRFVHSEGLIPEANIYYAIDGKEGRQQTKNNAITLPSTPGKHIFQFYYDSRYSEIYTDSLLIEAQHEDEYEISLAVVIYRQELLKPVIYLYPEEETEVKVNIDIHGENPFLYPKYADSWDFAAFPNGDLQFGDKTYNYLFWEAQTRTILTPKQTASGFFVKGEDAVSFLEEKLTLAGFNSKEQADFITFWGPRLAKNKLNFVHFVFNEKCNEYADLDITPKPNNIYRIFMIWGSVTEEFRVSEQIIEQFDRTGFSVLEWGGKEAHIKQSFVNLNKE